jgi:hypothetical protein
MKQLRSNREMGQGTTNGRTDRWTDGRKNKHKEKIYEKPGIEYSLAVLRL